MGQGSEGFLKTNLAFAIIILFPLFWMIGSIFFAIHLDSYYEATENYKQLLKSKRYMRKQILLAGDAYASTEEFEVERRSDSRIFVWKCYVSL